MINQYQYDKNECVRLNDMIRHNVKIEPRSMPLAIIIWIPVLESYLIAYDENEYTTVFISFVKN